jgi:hypothetical protein
MSITRWTAASALGVALLAMSTQPAAAASNGRALNIDTRDCLVVQDVRKGADGWQVLGPGEISSQGFDADWVFSCGSGSLRLRVPGPDLWLGQSARVGWNNPGKYYVR